MNCFKCKKQFNKLLELVCKNCYELQILRGQCLNAAIISLAQQGVNPDWDKFPKKAFEITKKLYDEGKEQKFLEW